MTKSKQELHDEIIKELARVHKERQALEHHKPGSLRRHQAKARLLRLHGIIAALEAELAKLVAAQAHEGKGAAVRYALAQEGVSESPPNSNHGKKIDFWSGKMGLPGGGYFWCGIFAGYCVVYAGKAKVPTPVRLCSGTYVIDDARGGHNGLHAVKFSQIQKGDLLSYWNGEHIGLALAPPVGGVLHTIEGNTSPSTAGSQYNGGCVARKTRDASDVTAAARPAWR